MQYYMTRTTVKLLAVQTKEQKYLEVLVRAKSSSRVVRNFTTASGSLAAHSYSAHTPDIPSLWEPMCYWTAKTILLQRIRIRLEVLEAGKQGRLSQGEENGFDKKFVEKVLKKIITKQPLPRTNGWSEGDSAKPQSFQCKQNGFRSQKIQHSRCASWFGGLLSHGATKYLGCVCLGSAETQPAVVETPIMGKSWKVTMTCYGRAQG